MNTQPSDERRKKKSRNYLLTGILFFLLMGFFWALDPSIVYILCGAGIACTFMALWIYPWNIKNRFSQQTTTHPDYASHRTSFKGAKSGKSEQKNSQAQQTNMKPVAANGEVKKYVIFSIAALIFFFVMVGIFSSDDKEEDAAFYFSMAEDFRNRDLFDSSRYYYLQAIKRDPALIDAWNNYGVLWMGKERYDSALWYFDQTLTLDDEFEQARYNKSLVFYYQKNYKRSISEALALLEINPVNNDALQHAGDIYYVQQRYDSAMYWYQEGYDNGNRNAWLCHVMGYLCDIKGEREKAIHLYQEAVEYDPYKKDVFIRLGELMPGPEGEQYRKAAEQLKSDGY
jgi:tetratricopeptide (TPR) repeat protein